MLFSEHTNKKDYMDHNLDYHFCHVYVKYKGP